MFPIEGSVSGEVIRTGKTVVLADAAGDRRVRQPALRAGGFGPALIAPLPVRGTVLGTLLVANTASRRPFGAADVQLTETFAEQAAVAVEHARLQQELDRLAVLEDRERIAKELHDGVIQALFAVGIGLQALGHVGPDPDLQRRIAVPSRSWTGSSATCATTSSVCAPASWPTGSSTRPCTGWPRSWSTRLAS